MGRPRHGAGVTTSTPTPRTGRAACAAVLVALAAVLAGPTLAGAQVPVACEGGAPLPVEVPCPTLPAVPEVPLVGELPIEELVPEHPTPAPTDPAPDPATTRARELLDPPVAGPIGSDAHVGTEAVAIETGPAAVLRYTRSATPLLLLALAVAAFLAFEAVLARRNPSLTAAPVDRHETELEFR